MPTSQTSTIPLFSPENGRDTRALACSNVLDCRDLGNRFGVGCGGRQGCSDAGDLRNPILDRGPQTPGLTLERIERAAHAGEVGVSGPTVRVIRDACISTTLRRSTPEGLSRAYSFSAGAWEWPASRAQSLRVRPCGVAVRVPRSGPADSQSTNRGCLVPCPQSIWVRTRTQLGLS
jgi:hypothetical protein